MLAGQAADAFKRKAERNSDVYFIGGESESPNDGSGGKFARQKGSILHNRCRWVDPFLMLDLSFICLFVYLRSVLTLFHRST